MELSTKEKSVLKVLVEKELEHVQKDFDRMTISNSPFLTKVTRDDSDLEFMKNETEYIAFLKDLISKL